MSLYGGDMQPSNHVMVAIGKDKNSGHAFRWTINHIDKPVIIAIHVKHKDVPRQGGNVLPPDKDDVANIFNPLRQMCNDKVVMMKEAIINDIDIVRGILEYIQRNHIQTLVIGAHTSTKNILSRSLNMRTISKKIKGLDDVPTTIIKAAPDYTSVYVISKGKIVATRPATSLLENMVMQPEQSLGLLPSKSQNGVRTHTYRRGSTNSTTERLPLHGMPRASSARNSTEDIDIFNHGQRSQFSYMSGSNGDLEVEMKQLRLQLKQTVEMYDSACKEAISAKNKAKEINQWKSEGAHIVEEAVMSKEAALALAEKEKARAKVAFKAVEEAMKLAGKEAHQRLQAEIKAKREAEEKDRALTVLVEKDTRYRRYSIQDIENATQKFSPSMRIGEGGYGPVFKGILDHTPVAIKILSPHASQGRKQFNQEVEVLCSIRHPNMVLLLGACPEYGCLVYEYMDNGSLEDRLLRKHNSPPIPWRKRFEIAYEIATTLHFLHQAKPEPIVHRDLKPANILLNRNCVSKISDVGLARLVPPSVVDSVTQYYMTSAAGTLCYIDPEYQQTGMLTTRSDIYSLGITFLQIITAKPPMGLAHHVKRAIENGTLSDMLDPLLIDCPFEEALAFSKLSLSCAELSKKDRPDLATVVLPELNRLREFGTTVQNRI